MEIEKINLRIAEIIKHYELSAATFADSIQVQRSSISHLLKGRNKPSLEFVSKLIKTYPEVDFYWLAFGKGQFPKKTAMMPEDKINHIIPPKSNPKTNDKKVDKVMVFYSDGTFESYDPK